MQKWKKWNLIHVNLIRFLSSYIHSLTRSLVNRWWRWWRRQRSSRLLLLVLLLLLFMRRHTMERKKVKTFRLSSLRSLDIFAMPSLRFSIEFVMCSHSLLFFLLFRSSNLCVYMWYIHLKVIYISHQKNERKKLENFIVRKKWKKKCLR